MTESNEKQSSSNPSTPPGEDRVLSISKKGRFFEDHYFENVWDGFEKAMDEMIHREEQKKKATGKQDHKEIINQLKNDMLLEAEKKQQKYLNKTHHLEAESSYRPKFSRLNSYKNLRSWSPDTETQAATITHDDNGYKVWNSDIF